MPDDAFADSSRRDPAAGPDLPLTPPAAHRSWQPMGWQARLVAVLLAVALAVGLLWEAVQPKLRLMNARAARGEAPVPMGLPTPEFEQERQATICRNSQDRAPGCAKAPIRIQVLPARPAPADAGASGQ
jgi:hypothetical protein